MSQNNQMTYKQAIKILSEVKVADLPYNGCRGNQTAWDIARKMAIQALKEKEQAEMAAESANAKDVYADSEHNSCGSADYPAAVNEGSMADKNIFKSQRW